MSSKSILASQESTLQLQLLTTQQQHDLATSVFPQIIKNNELQNKIILAYLHKVYDKQRVVALQKERLQSINKDVEFMEYNRMRLQIKREEHEKRTNRKLIEMATVGKEKQVLGYQGKFVMREQLPFDCVVQSQEKGLIVRRDGQQPGTMVVRSKYPLPTQYIIHYCLSFQHIRPNTSLTFQLGIVNCSESILSFFYSPNHSGLSLNGRVVQKYPCSISANEEVMLVLDCAKKVMVVAVEKMIVCSVSWQTIKEEHGFVYLQLGLNDSNTKAYFRHRD